MNSILTNKEHDYLSDVIRPFKEDIRYIRKTQCYERPNAYFITIAYLNDVTSDYTDLPLFKNEMYKGMEIDKKYSLKELGLE